MNLNKQEIERLQSRIGYTFSSPHILTQALTHASACVGKNKNLEYAKDYERLEFLGDLVLGLCVGEILFNNFTKDKEGELSMRLHSLVNGNMCYEIANELGLLDFIRKGNEFESLEQGKLGSKTKGVLADVFESLLAAIYLDGGIEAAKQFTKRVYNQRLLKQDMMSYDSKTKLQEWAHKQGYSEPIYTLQSRQGPDHEPYFVFQVNIGEDYNATGAGGSKRIAEAQAALNLLLNAGVWQRLSDGTIKSCES